VLNAFITSLSLLKSVKIIIPLLVYFALKLIVLASYLASTGSRWTTLWALFIRGATGDELGHYPLHLLLMQKILGRFDMILYVLIGSVVTGATTLLVSSAYRKDSVSLKAGIAGSLRAYPHVAGAALVVSVLLLGAVYLTGAGAERLEISFAPVPIGIASLLGLFIQALFVYAMPFVVLGGRPAFGALGGSVRAAARSFPRTFVIVLVPFVLILPLTLLEFKAGYIAARITPDVLVYLQVAGEFLHAIASYLTIGCATIVYIWRNG
jgi:hypothetical protein